jgi:hypothetical protein
LTRLGAAIGMLYLSFGLVIAGSGIAGSFD